MLVISRKADQSMVLAQRIHVTVLEVLSSSILLEIRAPKNTRVEWETGRGKRGPSNGRTECDLCVVMDTHATILINREITVTVVGIKQEKARLGFIAPKHISVQRGEVSKESDRK